MAVERILDRLDPMIVEALEKHREGLQVNWQTGAQLFPQPNGGMEFHVWLYLESPSPIVGMVLNNLVRLGAQVFEQEVIDVEVLRQITTLKQFRAYHEANPAEVLAQMAPQQPQPPPQPGQPSQRLFVPPGAPSRLIVP